MDVGFAVQSLCRTRPAEREQGENRCRQNRGFHKTSEHKTKLISSVFKVHSDVLDRITIFINEADTEIAQAGAVDDGAANDVPALIEREAFGDTVIHHHAPIAGE